MVLLCMQVPLAEKLSEYIVDLQAVTFTMDGGQTSINFAEAALVVQGTTAVYSKKVSSKPFLNILFTKYSGRFPMEYGHANAGTVKK